MWTLYKVSVLLNDFIRFYACVIVTGQITFIILNFTSVGARYGWQYIIIAYRIEADDEVRK